LVTIRCAIPAGMIAFLFWGLPAGADDAGGGLAWNNVTHMEGRGRGVVRNGSDSERFAAVTVDIDRGGKILVTFRTQRRKPLAFSGALMSSEEGTLKADVASSDQARLRGPMYLERDAHGAIVRISLDATNGQNRLHVDWDRR
jgi:hypothetical protein